MNADPHPEHSIVEPVGEIRPSNRIIVKHFVQHMFIIGILSSFPSFPCSAWERISGRSASFLPQIFPGRDSSNSIIVWFHSVDPVNIALVQEKPSTKKIIIFCIMEHNALLFFCSPNKGRHEIYTVLIHGPLIKGQNHYGSCNILTIYCQNFYKESNNPEIVSFIGGNNNVPIVWI